MSGKVHYWFTACTVPVTPEWSYIFLLRIASTRNSLTGSPADTQVDIVDKSFCFNDEETREAVFKRWCAFCDYLQEKYKEKK